MTTRKLELLLFILLLPLNLLFACSCVETYFCDQLDDSDLLFAVKGVIVKTVDYSENNQAGYLKILETYRDNIGITDTIKLYGEPDGFYCVIDISRYQVNDTIFILTKAQDEPYVNPDSLKEQFYENRLYGCLTNILIQRDGLVLGRIAESDDEQNQVLEYPIEEFETAMATCEFRSAKIKEYHCQESDFKIYPNPIRGSHFFIESRIKSYKFDHLRIISSKGQEIKRYEHVFYEYHFGVDIADLANGIYFLEFHCRDKRIIKKIMILR